MTGTNKHENILIRKKFKKSDNYICCSKPTGNHNKEQRGCCCTYPMVYKRITETFFNIKKCNTKNDSEIYLDI